MCISLLYFLFGKLLATCQVNLQSTQVRGTQSHRRVGMTTRIASKNRLPGRWGWYI